MLDDDYCTVETKLRNIDRNFCMNIEKFVINRNDNFDKHDTMARMKFLKIGRKIICNYIIERCGILIQSNSIIIPDFKNEHELNRWFKENCNNLGLEVFNHHKRHAKFIIAGKKYDGIDYICKIADGFGFSSCNDNYYSPPLITYMDDTQKKIYLKFCNIVKSDFLPIELEYLSSNFIKHGHSDIVSMVICYKKDKDLAVPILELKNTEAKK